ncbi:MAG: signal peptidase I [Alteromonadaceae bacterium]|nr:signal peptidase I [Alteromonadaceae bacterium]
MNLDFPLILLSLTVVTGLVWLFDILVLKPRRLGRGAASDSAEAGSDPDNARPYLVELSQSFFPILAVVLVLRSFLVEPFQIPSGSMLPTLEVGDFILVNKFSYGLRLPVAGTKVVDIGDPERGDVMVFKFPSDGQTNYIKRVIGLPGDQIRYRDKTLYINGEEVETRFVAALPPVELYQEDLGETEHQIFLTSGKRDPRAEGEWLVPQGHYFVMGDNRDNSNDSRYWGFVPEELVVGEAFAIWMHWESLTSIPSFDRIGGIE